MARIAWTRCGEISDERHFDALLLEDRERQLVAVVEDRRRLVHLADPADRLAVGQPVAQPDDEPGPSHQRYRRDEDERRDDAGDDARVLAASRVPFALELVVPGEVGGHES